MHSHSARRAFVICEDPVVAGTLAGILRVQGFGVLAFTDSLDAMASALVEPPELLLSDIVMSRMSGLELALEVKILAPACRVLLFSNELDTIDILREAFHGDCGLESVRASGYPGRLQN